MSIKSNPVIYFEIPVNKIERTIEFYRTVFGFGFNKANIDDNEMALLPFVEENSRISVALTKGEIYNQQRMKL
jgi:uncharacterized protein